MTNPQDNYDELTPDTVIDAVESVGFLSDARIIELNSYENRVYQVGIDEQTPVIAKFYRPHRWSDEAIREEHQFSLELMAAEIPVVAPLVIKGETLFEFNGYRFALFPRQGGYAPEVGDLDQLNSIGRLMGRIHRVAQSGSFSHRRELSLEGFCTEPSAFLLEHDFIPSHQAAEYEQLITSLYDSMKATFAGQQGIKLIRCHGDCHVGNILWLPDKGPHFVDLDDCMTAPAIQDLWMLIAGTREEKQIQFSEILDGYQEFSDFNPRELHFIESLRTLRMIHYAGWLARRWDDPAFPMHFPWFNTELYWQQHIADLKDQRLLLDQPPLQLFNM